MQNQSLLRKWPLVVSFLTFLAANLVAMVVPPHGLIQLLLHSVSLVVFSTLFAISLHRQGQVLKLKNSQQIISKKDAYSMPIVISISLFSLYLLNKYIPKQYMRLIMTSLFSVIAVVNMIDLLSRFILLNFEVSPSLKNKLAEVNLGKIGKTILDTQKIQVNPLHLLMLPFCLAVVLYHAQTDDWRSNNFIAFIITVKAVSDIGLDSIKVGLIVQWGLFFYDIFWVYLTDVMVSVAKSLNVPVLLKMPRPDPTDEKKFFMLGLGDIIIPGLFITVVLKYLVAKALSKDIRKVQQICLRQYWLLVFAYGVGIGLTGLAMFYFQHPQPALLFLVPCVTLTFLLSSLKRKQFSQRLQWHQPCEDPIESTKQE